MTGAGEIEVRLLRSEEAALLVDLIRRCYGESYIDPSFYDVAGVEELLDSGRLSSIGAVTTDSRLVGHMALSLRPHGGNTADAGMTLVDPDFRGRGIAKDVAVGLAKRAIALGLVGAHDYPVTVHAATQRIGAGFGVDMGLMLANMPADVEFQAIERAAEGTRTSSLIRWLPFGRAPERIVHLPGRYAARIRDWYARAHLRRSVSSARSALSSVESDLEVLYDERRRTLRIAVLATGADVSDRIASETDRAFRNGALIAHVDLSLSDHAVVAIVDAIRSIGFFFAGLLPEYRNGDVIRLQRLSDAVDQSVSGVLSTADTRGIETFVLGDRPKIDLE